jgi:uncharacterized protein (TIGR03435 family)
VYVVCPEAEDDRAGQATFSDIVWNLHTTADGGTVMKHRGVWLFVVATGIVVPLSAQAPAPAFEVASVKPAVPGTPGSRIRFLPGGRFVGENVAIEFVLQRAYGLRSFQIIASPEVKAIIADGYNSRYQIEGKGPESASEADLKEMAKTLLADRFQLRSHKEIRDVPVYALVVARGGVKGARAADGKGGGIASMLPGWIRGQGTAPGFLAETLSSFVDRPVVDRTNLNQVIDFDLTWTPEGTAAPDASPGCPPGFQEMANRMKMKLPDSGCPSIFTAVQEQLGLRLESQLAPMDVLVVDSVRPLIGN